MLLIWAYTYNGRFSWFLITLLLLSTCSFGFESCQDATIRLCVHDKSTRLLVTIFLNTVDIWTHGLNALTRILHLGVIQDSDM